MTYTDREIRHMAISFLNAETERDRQQVIGASTLSNPCDYCLASGFLGIERDIPGSNQAWGGRIIGTAIHSHIEQNAAQQRPDATLEAKVTIGEIPGYGVIPGHFDYAELDEEHLVDWKNTTLEKTIYMRDYLGQTNYGRDNKFVAVYSRNEKGLYRKAKAIVSENVYNEKLHEAAFKVEGYRAQLHLYGRALRAAGRRIQKMSNVFVARDSTMWFDNPAAEGYDDPTKMHGVWVLSFDFDPQYAEDVWERGLRIWRRIEGGEGLDDFDRHAYCTPCTVDSRNGQTADPIPPAPKLAAVVTEATLVGEAA